MAAAAAVGHYRHLTPEQRWAAVRGCTELGLTRAVVAQQLGTTVRSIGRLLQLFRDTGDIVERHAGGRDREYSHAEMRRLDLVCYFNPHANAAGLIELMGPRAPPISERTMRKYRRELGYTRRREGIQLYDSPRYIAERHAWAQQHRNDPILRWVFMDESTMLLRHTGDVVYVKRGQPMPEHMVDSIVAAVHIWGAVWDGGSTFAQYQGHLTSDTMFGMLDDHLSQYAHAIPGHTVVNDGATYHWTAEVRGWYDAVGLVPLKLPPKSPRFNAIERCWGWIKKRVKAAGPHNQAQLSQALTNACQAITQRAIRGFIRETKRQIREG